MFKPFTEEFEGARKRLVQLGILKDSSTIRTQRKYIKEYAHILEKAHAYTPRIVSDEIAKTIDAGTAHGGGATIIRHGRRNIAMFYLPVGGSVRVNKKSVTIFKPTGRETIHAGVFADGMVPENLPRLKRRETYAMRGGQWMGQWYGDPEELDAIANEEQGGSPSVGSTATDGRHKYFKQAPRTIQVSTFHAAMIPWTKEQRKAQAEKRKAENKAWKLK